MAFCGDATTAVDCDTDGIAEYVVDFYTRGAHISLGTHGYISNVGGKDSGLRDVMDPGR